MTDATVGFDVVIVTSSRRGVSSDGHADRIKVLNFARCNCLFRI